MQALGAALFGIALAHTLGAKYFEVLAHRHPRHAGLLHLLGEVEVVFGFWAFVLIAVMAAVAGGQTAIDYAESRQYTEPLFVFVVMVVAASKPVLEAVRQLLQRVARTLPLPTAWVLAWLGLAAVPLLGSLITEPAAMTLAALMLRPQIFHQATPERLKYAALGVLFVNVSIGGTLTAYAAPPVLMVAGVWQWDTAFMASTFGWRAALAVLVNATAMVFFLRKHLASPTASDPSAAQGVPWMVSAIHLLFLAGVVPAVVLALCLMVAIYVRARLADRYPGIRTPFPVLMRATLYAAPALLVPLMLVIGIATGFATPTEISSVAVVYGLALSVLLYRELTWYKLWRSISDTGVKAGMILFITATASTFAYTLTSAGIPTRIAELMIEIAGRSSWVFMLASLLVLVVMGALLEGLPALLVFAPILMPLAPKFGVSPIQYGIVLLIAMGLGCFAPIIGVGMYISCSVTGTKVEPASRAMVPYAVILFLGLLLVAFVPWFSLVLPRLFGFI
jgi:TRAP-type C4-dicarboxylate transport system permease large subunit